MAHKFFFFYISRIEGVVGFFRRRFTLGPSKCLENNQVVGLGEVTRVSTSWGEKGVKKVSRGDEEVYIG